MTGARQFSSLVSQDTGIVIIEEKQACCPKCGGTFMSDAGGGYFMCWGCGKYSVRRKLVLKEPACKSL